MKRMELKDFKWTAKDRAQHIKHAKEQRFDLVIIGGGITGAGIAREAALRNLSFIIIDKSDFAFGTSSRSSKLAHGGFRYLKNGEFGIVRESTTERNWLRCHFPNLVRPLGFYFYSLKGSSMTPMVVKIGMKLYDFLSDAFSKFKNYKKNQMYTPEEMVKLEPKFIREGLLAVGLFYDTNIDDARLTVESIKEALFLSKGKSIALNYVKVIDFIAESPTKLAGVKVKDQLTQEEWEIHGTQVINATGIWTDDLLKNTGSKIIRPTKGVHVIIKNERLGNQKAYGVTSIDDHRTYFILRREKFTMIGTTDTDFKENLDKPVCNKQDSDYLLHTVNYLFPDAHLTDQDIISTYAGVRPLVMEPGKSESKVSRKHCIIDHPNGLVSLIGGKLTIYRLMGEQLLYHLMKDKGLFSQVPANQRKKAFSKQPFLVGLTWSDFSNQYEVGLKEGRYPKIDADLQEYLHREYGKQAFAILDLIKADPKKGERFIPENEFIPAEVEWILDHENVVTLLDILIRRSEMWMYVHHSKAKEIAEKVGTIMGKYFGWMPQKLTEEIQSYVDYVKEWVWFK